MFEKSGRLAAFLLSKISPSADVGDRELFGKMDRLAPDMQGRRYITRCSSLLPLFSRARPNTLPV